MSTPGVSVFTLGQEASASAFNTALKTLQSQGAAALNTIEQAQTDTLVEFERRFTAITGRGTRAARILSSEQSIKFVVSDFSDIDQANTVCTIRADSASVSLRERAEPAEAVIKTNNFSANKGTIQALNSAQTILRVATDDFSTPTGQFDITLVTPLTLSQLIVDIVATPSQPSVAISVSGDGITYTTATSVTLSGFVITAQLPSLKVMNIRIQITPVMPDNLNGNTFTFGITNFDAQATTYQLRSDLLTKTLQFSSQSEFVTFEANPDSRIQYFLSIYSADAAQAPFVEVNAGDSIQIGTAVRQQITTIPSIPYFLGSAPSDIYFNTLSVTESGVDARIAPALSPDDPNLANLQDEYVVLIPTSIGYDITLLNASQNYNPPRTFMVSYVYGPALVNVQLKVRLSTSDDATSPVFTGASLNAQ